MRISDSEIRLELSRCDEGHTIIATTCFSQTDLRPGDIITWQRETGFGALHQIIQVLPTGVVTKGIHNEVADPGIVEWRYIQTLVVAIIY